MDEKEAKILYSYDRTSFDDEEAKKRYSLYMRKMLEILADAQKKGGSTK